jgi:hypothetical protein
MFECESDGDFYDSACWRWIVVAVNDERAVVSTLAGGVSGTNGVYADGSGTNASFAGPVGVAVDASGNVYVADQNSNRIRKVTADGGTRIGPVTLCACSADIDVAAPARSGWMLMH